MYKTRYTYNEKNEYKTVAMLKELTAYSGISSDENEISELLLKKLADICDNCSKDIYGNVTGYIYSMSNTDKNIILEAHLDRIGLMVKKINKDGSVTFVSVGGFDERVLPGSEVCILGGKCIYGIIYLTENSSERKIKIDNMRIDTGLEFDEAKDLIHVGDMIMVQSKFSKLYGYQYSSAAMDNRAGIVSILQALEKINKSELKYNLIILFSVQEELGLHGAYAAGNQLNCDAAIVVDVTHGTTPDTKNETGVFDLGSGAIICRGPNFAYEYSRKLVKLANNLNIPNKIEVASGSSGTCAWALQTAGTGVPCMLISIPLKYMHTTVETLDIRDIDAVSELISEALTGGVDID